jgi:putative arylsulfatase
MAATADRVPCVFIENGRVANYDPSAPIEVSYRKPFEGEPTGKTHPELLYNLRSSHGHDMAIVNGIGRIGYMKGGGKALWKDENIADSIATRAISFIQTHRAEHRDQPFFVYLATNDVHVPRFPHPRFRGQSGMGLRGDAIVQLDWMVGEVLRALDSLGIADDTLVLLSSDNGGVIDDGYDDQAEALLKGHNPSGIYRGYKYSAFEGGTRIPAIVRWPRRVRGAQTSSALVSQTDWIASFAELLGVKLPEGAAPDSRVQLATWLGRSSKSRPWILQQAADKTLSLRNERWKYIAPSSHGPMITWGPKIETGYLPTPQLYDMKRDPRERMNVADRHPDIIRYFQSLEARIRSGQE